ncbi:MAG: hypothetical protein ACD_7C00310G0002 [uncultured bacterium]|nr:MAG: hypothetical protein ACD_7C00310G0002 [uncultured bacterium]HBR78853.1 hypothetical protein [Candidatus Moranbacteria bacterium]
MPDEKVINPNLESIDDKDSDLAQKFGHVEGAKLELDKKESIVFDLEKEGQKEISEVEKDSAYSKIVSKVSQQASDVTGSDVKNDAQAVSEKMDAESQIQHLVDLATAKGVVHAIKVAKHLDDNYVLDILHDKMISEELHKVLVEKNFISPE